jgi:hypothetical protein
MPEHLLEIRVTQPGRITGMYLSQEPDGLRLEKVVYPEEELPFDVGMLPSSLTPFGEPYPVVVLGNLSCPPNTSLEARLIGALERDGTAFLVGVPTADESLNIPDQEHLPGGLRRSIEQTLNAILPGVWRWLSLEELQPLLHAGSLRYRQAKKASGRQEFEPEWRPLHLRRLSPSFAEPGRRTAAESTYYELPDRFQHYVNDCLAPREGVLYALQRPAMTSHKKHLWPREPLQAGVLILTNERLIHLTEITPPDSANIRYGFSTGIGVLERFGGASLETSNDGTLVLHTEWLASRGRGVLDWEVPAYLGAAMRSLTGLLQAFEAHAEDFAIQRATLPTAPESLPPLVDPASADAEVDARLNADFLAALATALGPGEAARAWALLPKWFTANKAPGVLVTTERRVFTLPDLSVDVSLAQIATLEYTSSILESSMVLNCSVQGRFRHVRLPFPYPAQSSFRACFEAARRCMAVAPLAP